MTPELETAYIGLESSQPAALARYLEDVVGLMPGERAADGALTWRADAKAQRLWVREGPRNDAACIGFEATSAQAFDQLISRLTRQGLAPTAGSAAEQASRRVRELVKLDTPWGVPLELVLGLAEDAVPFRSPHFPDGMVTRGQGFGHSVFLVGNAADYEASRRFAIDALGMKLSDWLRLPLPDAEMHVSFFHCNPRHHSLAIAFVPMPAVPQKLHHINFEVSKVATVGKAYERALRAGTPIANTIGQHANDGMVSFYSVGPDGWRVEIGATGRVIGDDWNDVREYDRISDWGHQPPASLAQMLAHPAASSH
jgi:2,3-dihydroxybiphenyl 1,2-dioxygenase